MFGNVRTSPTKHFVATGMRLVESMDEVSYHMIESAHAALKLQHCSSDTTPMSPKNKLQCAESNVDVPMASSHKVTAESSSKFIRLEGSALSDAIVAFLRQEADQHPEGSALNDIFEHMSSTSRDQVRKAVEQLIDEGYVYTLISLKFFGS